MKGCAPLQRAEPTERSPPTAGLLDSPYTKPTNCSWSPGASILASCAAASVAAARKSALSGAFRHTWRARAATASRTSGWRLQHRQAGRQAAGGGGVVGAGPSRASEGGCSMAARAQRRWWEDMHRRRLQHFREGLATAHGGAAPAGWAHLTCAPPARTRRLRCARPPPRRRCACPGRVRCPV